MEHTFTLSLTLLMSSLLQTFPALATPLSSPNTAAAIFGRNSECAAPTRCGRTSEAMLQCDKLGTDEIELRRCICTRDPNWETDVMECVLCWEAELPNYELSIAIDYANKHLCKPGPVDVCELQCTNAWHVYNTCGGLGQDKQGCICRYKYLWEAWTRKSFGFSCPECLEGNDEKKLADQISEWLEWPCEAMEPNTDSGFPDTGSTTDSDGMNDDARRMGGQMGLLWVLQTVAWVAYLL